MGLKYSAEHAVETLLSGPAASALGGSALAAEDAAIIVDIGGTTTDVALIEHGAPLLSEDGIRVGQWKTLVRGLFATSFALGGDSAVRWDKTGMLTLGPDRVIPLCVLASRNPEITEILRAQVERVPSHTLPLHEFLTLNRADWYTLPLTEEEIRVCRVLENGPKSLQQVADALGVDKYYLRTQSLERTGVILRAGLTPTDIMHVRGDYTAYDRKTSLLAARFVAQSLDTSLEELCREVYEHISREVFYAVAQMLLEHASPHFRQKGLDSGIRELLRMQWETRNSGSPSLLQYAFRSTAPLVGIGGPVHLFLPEAAKALGAPCIIPDCAAVANAVGAVTGQMSVSASAVIRPHGLPEDDEQGDFEVLCEGDAPAYFASEEEAVIWSTGRLKALTEQRLRDQGAVGILSFETVTDVMTSAAGAGRIRLAIRVTVTASTHLSTDHKEDSHV